MSAEAANDQLVAECDQFNRDLAECEARLHESKERELELAGDVAKWRMIGMEANGRHSRVCLENKGLVDKIAKIRDQVRFVLEQRELQQCWFVDEDGDTGDCSAGDHCNPHCPLYKLVELVR